MKTREMMTPFRGRISLCTVLAVMAMAGAWTSRAGLTGPYPVDGNTLHLWHFDETSGTLAYDALSNQQASLTGWVGSFTMTNVPGNPAFPTVANGGALATEFASNAQPAYVAYTNGVPYVSYNYCILTTNESSYMQQGLNYGTPAGASDPVPTATTAVYENLANYCNPVSGAFTMEALINLDENPQNLPNGQQDILCADSAAGTRGFIFGVYPITGGGADLDFFAIGSTIGNVQYGSTLTPIPTNGPDAAIQGQWYHVAVTYTGNAPTNGDTPNILTTYWTLMDPARTNCDVLWQTNVSLNNTKYTSTVGILTGETPVLDIGCSARENVSTENLSWAGFDGNIDEVRICEVCLHPDQMVFNYTNIPEPPTVAGLPTSETVANSVNLQLIPVVFGSLPVATEQWYQIANGVTNLLAGQTNSSLIITNVTALNTGGYFLAATNAYGGTNSAVVQVTVGLQSFDGLYMTGEANNGTSLTNVGGADPHWALPVDPDPNGIIPDAMVWTIIPSGSGFNPAPPPTGWIGPEDGSGTETGVYDYTTSFVIDQGTPTNATLSGILQTAGGELGSQIQCIINGVTNIILNGVYAGGVETDPFSFTGTNCGFQLGSNTLTLIVTNTNPENLAQNGIDVYGLTGTSTALTNAPYITNQPGNVTVNYGQTATFDLVAIGAPALNYEWVTNGQPANFGGKNVTAFGPTNRVLTFVATNVIAASVHNGVYTNNYYVVVTNSEGVVTSAVAELTINILPTLIGQLPATYTNLFTLYEGASPSFSVQVGGAPPPFAYHWYTNGVWDTAVTASNLVMNNVQIGFFTNYCVVTNLYALPITSMVWTAQVIADPPAPYPTNVLALNPIGYWRLNDVNLDGADNGGGDNGYVCEDYVGGNNGIYTNVLLGQQGYNPTTDPSDTSADFGDDPDGNNTDYGNEDANSIAGINFSTPYGSSRAFTVEAWVNGYVQTYDAGMVTLGWGGGGEQFNLDCGSDTLTTHGFRFFIRDASGITHGVSSAVSPLLGTWYHLVGVVDEISNQDVVFYINGQPVGTASLPSGDGILASTYQMSIGARSATVGTSLENQFEGYMNDVAVFNYALSPLEVENEYIAGGGTNSPYFAPTPPATGNGAANYTLTVPVTALGSPPMNYWWTNMTTGAGIAAGTANNASGNVSLSYPNVPLSWNGDQLQLTVSNAWGSTNASLTVSIFNSGPTNIVFEVTNKQLSLSWPSDHIGWQLQAQTNKLSVGLGTNWVNVPNSQNTNEITVPINLTNGSVFYRLIYP